jgi:hypothetical protein
MAFEKSLSTMTFSQITLSLMTLYQMTLIIMAINTMTLGIKLLVTDHNNINPTDT